MQRAQLLFSPTCFELIFTQHVYVVIFWFHFFFGLVFVSKLIFYMINLIKYSLMYLCVSFHL